MHKDKRIMNWQPFMNKVYVHAIIIITITTTILIADNKITFYNAMKLTLLMNTIQKVMNIQAGFSIFYCLGHLFSFYNVK